MTKNKPLWSITVGCTRSYHTSDYLLYGELHSAIDRAMRLARRDENLKSYDRGRLIVKEVYRKGTLDQ